MIHTRMGITKNLKNYTVCIDFSQSGVFHAFSLSFYLFRPLHNHAIFYAPIKFLNQPFTFAFYEKHRKLFQTLNKQVGYN